jgi:hypothetical protein
MRTETVSIHSVSELPETIKAKVLDKYRYEFCDWFDEQPREDAKECSHMTIVEYGYSDRSYIICEFNKSAEDTAKTVLENHGESCSSYTIASNFLSALSSLESQPENCDSLTAMDFLEENFLEDMGAYYLNMLQSEYDHMTSDEAVTESLESNGYEFLENGDRYRK